MASDLRDHIAELHAQFTLKQSQKQYADALAAARKCQNLIPQVPGDPDVKFAVMLEEFAQLYRSQNDWVNAERALRQAFEIRSTISGAGSREALADLFQIASLYELQGDHITAKAIYRQAVEIQRRALRGTLSSIPPLIIQPAVPQAPIPPPIPTAPTSEPSIEESESKPAPSSTELTRYGRVEYYSPLEVQKEYPLRVGVLLREHLIDVAELARVGWGKLRFTPNEPEPILQIIPVATFLQIAPAQRNLKVKAQTDVFADFKIVAMNTPPHGMGTLEIEVEYAGELVKRITVPLTVQDQIKLGPLRIPRAVLSNASFVLGSVMAIPSVIGFFDTLAQLNANIQPQLVLCTLLAALLLIGAGVTFLRSGGKRTAQAF